MSVDLTGNELWRNRLFRSVNFSVLMKVESYASAHQLASAVRMRNICWNAYVQFIRLDICEVRSSNFEPLATYGDPEKCEKCP